MRLIRRLRVSILAVIAPLALFAGQAEAQPPHATRALAWLDGFDRDADDLPRAIAQLEHGGGVVTEIWFDGRGGHPGFDAALEQSGRVVFVRLARGQSRYISLSRRDQPDWITGWRAHEQLAAALHANVGLAAAVQQAESDTGNLPAVAAGVATQASAPLRYAPAYNVLLLTPGDALQRVVVDARTGLSVADLGALTTWPRPLP